MEGRRLVRTQYVKATKAIDRASGSIGACYYCEVEVVFTPHRVTLKHRIQSLFGGVRLNLPNGNKYLAHDDLEL